MGIDSRPASGWGGDFKQRGVQSGPRLGGGEVEAYPEDYTNQKVSSSFLCSGTLGMFEKAGFRKARKIAMHRWVAMEAVPGTGQRTKPGKNRQLSPAK